MNQKTDTAFVEMHKGHMTAYVRQEGAETIADALCEHKECVPFDAVGRDTMLHFPWRDGRRGIMRSYRRGGLAGRFLKEGFFLCNRPLREFHTHQQVAARGIPAPLLLGVCWKRRGPFFYGALATELMAGSDLDTWLCSRQQDAAAVRPLLQRCGASIRHMHDKGVVHADLQVKNIFVGDEGPCLLDFDRAQTTGNVRPLARMCNLLRLRRSFEKRGHPMQYWHWLLEGYGNVTFPAWLRGAYRVKAMVSDMIQGRRTMQV